MTRLLELIIALIIVFILALIVGVALSSTGHIERSVTISKDIRHVYDLFNNFRRLPDYSPLKAYDPNIKFDQSGDDWYGPGAKISWSSMDTKIGNGSLTIVSAKPGFDKVNLTGEGTIVWALKNGWHGTNKTFTIHLKRSGRLQNLVDITWNYDVDYGWNLINRYSGLYIHGAPDSFIQSSLNQLQSLMASIPNIDYGGLDPQIVKRPLQPILLVKTSAKRNLTYLHAATDAAMAKLDAAMKKLGLHQTGPRIRFTINYGNSKITYMVGVPVNSATVTINDKKYTMGRPHLPTQDADVAAASSVATASSSAKPNAAPTGPQPGDVDKRGRLIVNENVRGMMAFGGTALEAVWFGSPAGVPPTRMRLKAYAETHGYPFDDVTHPIYDRQVLAYQSTGPDGKPVFRDQQTFKVYLPLSAAPKTTPEQAAGMHPQNPFYAPANTGSAPAPAGSAPAPASSVPVTTAPTRKTG